MKIIVSGKSDTIPFKLPDGTELDSYTNLNWSMSATTKKIGLDKIDLKLFAKSFIVSIMPITTVDLTGIGISDGGSILGFLGLLISILGVVISICPG